ncbi:Lactonase, 7-bladed beta-propeller-domain-containing protein [Mycena floridula]|nr:Lactonase, 7-bladed beta-propeller-domain-containing protein [Mycena floridula]
MPFKVLAATFTDDVYTINFDPVDGSLSLVSFLTVGCQPSWLTRHPIDKSLVFTALKQPDGQVVAIKYNDQGIGAILAQESSGGDGPSSVLASADQVFVANYPSGTVAALSVSTTLPFIQKGNVAQLHGSGPNLQRQESPHPHQVILRGQELLVPDLGTDRTWRFSATDFGEPLGFIQYASGMGPRHIALLDDYVLTLHELGNAITCHRLDPFPAEPVLVCGPKSTLSAEYQDREVLGGEILIPVPNATYPRKYIYISNRIDPIITSPDHSIHDTIDRVCLTWAAEISTGLRHLRGMEFGGPDDKFLVAGGLYAGGVKVFERIDGGKGLKAVAQNVNLKSPTGFLWM